MKRKKKTPPPKVEDKKKVQELKKLVNKATKKRKFIYIPDFYSRVFGIIANPVEKRFFLTKNRVFTGAEIRKVIA